MVGEKAMTTEDELMDGIDFGDDDEGFGEDVGGASGGNVQGASTADEGTGEAAASQAPTSGKQDGTGTQQGAPGDTGTRAQGQSNAQQQTPQTGLAAYSMDPRLRQDGKGNLVDPSSGKIVFNAGRERRLFEDKLRLTRASEEASKQVETLTTQLAQARALEGVPQSLGLSSEEARIGLQLAAGFKTKPLETIKYILEQAKARGYNIGEAGAGTDVGAIKQMLEQQFQPFVQQQQQSAAVEKARNDAQRELDQFYSRYPDASLHEDSIATLLEQDKAATLETAYLRLANYAIANGLSMGEPLRLQLERKLAQQQGGGMNTNGGVRNGQGQRPMLNGSAGIDGAGGASQQHASAEVYDDPSTNWADIVRNALREANGRSQ